MTATKHWEDELAAGRFVVQHDGRTGKAVFPPRDRLEGEAEWRLIDGGGTVYSVTVIHPKPPATPYNVALIDLDEGVRLMSRVEGMAPEAIKIGMRVRARLAQEDTGPILVFDPA